MTATDCLMHLCVDIPLSSNSQASTWGCHEWAYGTIWQKVNPTTGGWLSYLKRLGNRHTRGQWKGADCYDNMFLGMDKTCCHNTPQHMLSEQPTPFRSSLVCDCPAPFLVESNTAAQWRHLQDPAASTIFTHFCFLLGTLVHRTRSWIIFTLHFYTTLFLQNTPRTM